MKKSLLRKQNFPLDKWSENMTLWIKYRRLFLIFWVFRSGHQTPYKTLLINSLHYMFSSGVSKKKGRDGLKRLKDIPLKRDVLPNTTIIKTKRDGWFYDQNELKKTITLVIFNRRSIENYNFYPDLKIKSSLSIITVFLSTS